MQRPANQYYPVIPCESWLKSWITVVSMEWQLKTVNNQVITVANPRKLENPLGILIAAYKCGFLKDLRLAVDSLGMVGFRVSQKMIDKVRRISLGENWNFNVERLVDGVSRLVLPGYGRFWTEGNAQRIRHWPIIVGSVAATERSLGFLLRKLRRDMLESGVNLAHFWIPSFAWSYGGQTELHQIYATVHLLREQERCWWSHMVEIMDSWVFATFLNLHHSP